MGLVLLLLAALVLVAVPSVMGVLGGPAGASASSSASPAGATGLAAIPPAMLELYAEAAASCPGLAWQVLAAVGTVESDNGLSSAPGVHSGHNGAGAEGPMQFEPATFAGYDRPVPPGGADPPTPYDPADAVWAAARLLCASGAATPTTVGQALWDYNHSGAYVADVLRVAASYGYGSPGGGTNPGEGPGAIAVEYALAQVGTPYRWGGEQAGVGFDCSGLAQAAFAVAGVVIPRVAQAQFDAGPAVPPGRALAAGDLVFFGTGPSAVTHVGLVVDPAGVMVDAPHTGADVRVEPFPTEIGAAWGSDVYVGATAPGGDG